MCLPTPKPPPSPPPPPPPAPPAPSPELKKDEETTDINDPAGMKKGRKKLRIDMSGGASTGEGSGLNIPS